MSARRSATSKTPAQARKPAGKPARSNERQKPLTVALTGATGSLGKVVLPRLLADPRIQKVLALDLMRPELVHPKLAFAAADLAHPDAPARLADTLAAEHVHAVAHLAFFSSRVMDPSYAHEVEAVGTSHLLSACARARVRRLVLASTTLVYGASPQNPSALTEDRPLPPGATRGIADRIAAEEEVRTLRESCPTLRSTILRFAPVIGPTVDTPFTRLLRSGLVPSVLGHDPLVQALHEDDMAEAVRLALHADFSGELNIVGRGVLPWSRAIQLAGSRRLPLPWCAAHATLSALDTLGVASVPSALVAYLRDSCVADGRRAERALAFSPRYSTREALLSMGRTRRHLAA